MRTLGLALLVVTFGLVHGAPTVAQADDCAGGCGAPHCQEQPLTVRPGTTRQLYLSCWAASGASIVAQPAHGHISDLSSDYDGLRFTARTDADAPSEDHVVLRVQGPAKSEDVTVTLDVIPASINQAPICFDDTWTQRTDGSAPFIAFVHPDCWDPDGDDYTMDTGGPGSIEGLPKHFRGGENSANWNYHTAGSSGTEVQRIWATDSLGARSADAHLTVTFGPGIDRAPGCEPNPTGFADPSPVYMRPGVTRRFAVVCRDEDGDPFTARVAAPPARGALPVFAPRPVYDGWAGSEQWIDATYVPADASMDPDVFAVAARSPAGTDTVRRIAMTPVTDEIYMGAGCGSWGGYLPPDQTGDLHVNCSNGVGDPYTAAVVSQPAHGTVGTPVVTQLGDGSSDVHIPYTPEPGFTGYDCIVVRGTSDHGDTTDIPVDINVSGPAPYPTSFPTLPTVAPTLPVVPLPSPASVAKLVRQYVRGVLGTTHVHRQTVLHGAQLWTPRRLSRRRLGKDGRAPAMVIVCLQGCSVRSVASLTGASRRLARTSRTRSSASVTPAVPLTVWATAGPRRLRAGASPRVRIHTRIVQAGRHRTVNRALRLSGR